MKIGVVCSGHRYQQEIELILQLFYDELTVTFFHEGDPVPDAPMDMEIVTSLEQASGMIEATATATVPLTRQDREQEIFEARYQRPHELDAAMTTAGQQTETRKQEKQALKHVVLQVMEQVTGKPQSWGILTGIRPTKLLHTLREKGNPPAEAARILKEDYLLKPDRIALLEEIVDRQFEAIPDLNQLQGKEVSLYIGIPFCPTKCAYCTFPAYAINGKNGSVAGFLEGLHYEIDQIGQWLVQRGLGVTTIYFGGGTPTSIEADEMDRLFEHLARYIPLDQVRELTVEAGRPDTITPDKIDVMKKWRVDRISINPQSFTEETLQAIGRHHTVEETVEKFRLAREMGMDNINMDLIIGLPGETRRHLQDSLNQVEALMPESLTVHTLSFKRASQMTRNKERYRVAGPEEVEAMMEMASNWTREHQYRPYYLYRQKNILGNLENVGYALPGRESLYNIIIMEEKQTILGLGCGAVGKHIHPVTGRIERWPNPKEPKAYIERYRDLTAKKIRDLDEMYLDRALQNQ